MKIVDLTGRIIMPGQWVFFKGNYERFGLVYDVQDLEETPRVHCVVRGLRKHYVSKPGHGYSIAYKIKTNQQAVAANRHILDAVIIDEPEDQTLVADIKNRVYKRKFK